MRVRLITLLFGALFISSAASAQTTGRIVGAIMDQQDAAVPGVTVTVSSAALQGTRMTVTDQSGEFRLLSLPPGDYELKAELSGFQTVTRKAVRVGLDQTLTLNLTMAISGVTSAVTVTAAPTTIDVTSVTGGVVASAEIFNNLPIAPASGSTSTSSSRSRS